MCSSLFCFCVSKASCFFIAAVFRHALLRVNNLSACYVQISAATVYTAL